MPGKKRKFARVLRASKRRRLVSAFNKLSVGRTRPPRPRIRSQVNLGMSIPDKMTITHKYRELVQLSTAAGGMGRYSFSCNGMFDPNLTGTGHQPMYFDQLSALYNHYTVIGAKIKVRLVPYNQSQPALQFALFVNDDTALVPTTVDGVAEETKCIARLYPATQAYPASVTMKWSARKVFGPGIMANNSLQGTAAANPSEQQFFDLVYQVPTATGMSWWAECEIDYIAIWSERKDVGQS